MTTAFFSAALIAAKAGSVAMRWRTRAATPATCAEASAVPVSSSYSLPGSDDVTLPPGAAISGFSLRSGFTPHEEEFHGARPPSP